MRTKIRLTEERIIASAVALFAKQGYYKTTTAQLAQDLGVTQPYLFHFFKTKQALFLAVLEHGSQKIYDAFSAETLRHEANGSALIQAMGEAYKKLLATHRDEMLLVMSAYVIDEDAVRDKARDWQRRIFQLISDNLQRLGVANAQFETANFIGRGLFITMMTQLDIQDIDIYYKTSTKKRVD
jgi:AcrR family transcriptional regulator